MTVVKKVQGMQGECMFYQQKNQLNSGSKGEKKNEVSMVCVEMCCAGEDRCNTSKDLGKPAKQANPARPRV